jgi:hypothetical protein
VTTASLRAYIQMLLKRQSRHVITPICAYVYIYICIYIYMLFKSIYTNALKEAVVT